MAASVASRRGIRSEEERSDAPRMQQSKKATIQEGDGAEKSQNSQRFVISLLAPVLVFVASLLASLSHALTELVQPGENVKEDIKVVFLRLLFLGALVVEGAVAASALVIQGSLNKGADEEVGLVPALTARLVTRRGGDALDVLYETLREVARDELFELVALEGVIGMRLARDGLHQFMVCIGPHSDGKNSNGLVSDDLGELFDLVRFRDPATGFSVCYKDDELGHAGSSASFEGAVCHLRRAKEAFMTLEQC